MVGGYNDIYYLHGLFVWFCVVDDVMSDGVQGTSQMPFNVNSNIHTQTVTRERIENHLVEQRVQKEHRATHVHLEALQKQRLDLQENYDKFGRKTAAILPQGSNVSIEV